MKHAFGKGEAVESLPGAERADLARCLGRGEESRVWCLRLISELIHEMSQPLTVLYGELHLALEACPAGDRHQPLLESSAKQVALLFRLVQRFREMAQAEKLIELRHGTRMLEVVRAIMESLQPVAESKEIRLVLQANADAEVAISADRLEQMVHLLLSFALERSSNGTVVSVATRLTPAAASLCVIDQGPPLSAKQIALLIDPFSCDQDRQVRFVDRSLEWCLAKRIAEVWGGSLDLENGLQRGCSATLTVPCWLTHAG